MIWTFQQRHNNDKLMDCINNNSKTQKGTSEKARTSESIFLNEKSNNSENSTLKEKSKFGQNKGNACTPYLFQSNPFPMISSVHANSGLKSFLF